MYGKLTAHPGKRDELVAILLEAAEQLRANESCEAAKVLHKSSSDPIEKPYSNKNGIGLLSSNK